MTFPLDPSARGGPDGDVLRRAAAERFARWVDHGHPSGLPLPGAGRTRRRLRVLHDLALADLSLARLAEGHADALAILSELGAPPAGPGERWAVWAAQPPGAVLTARPGPGDDWLLDGVKPYCSGAHSCTHALVTADTDAGRRLFAVATGGPGYTPVAGTWQAVGMAGSDSPDVRFARVPARPVGDVDAYLRRPGFWHGGIGVAACWLGGAQGVADALRAKAGRSEPDALLAAHLGAVDVALHGAVCALAAAADAVDRDPRDREGRAEMRASRVRALVADVCARVLDEVGRALGAGPLCHDTEHAQRVADLTVYIRQHHAQRDLAALGAHLAGAKSDPESAL
ncbi:acyl-CoA dehydrogenase family protein [Streptomyces albidoflavus]|uniref:acyl-CoA dehydrogenase family protein n=1 Tax=Streptomyces albidoflavus TaxID=1886 RepID=UPI000FF3E9BA|nr:acyl-CoA dehydrogenase family protein [Streptomyces albidoflavus]RWZ72817.1 acyl-CoA dehydrogenase [Streptomyces albidoflavus]